MIDGRVTGDRQSKRREPDHAYVWGLGGVYTKTAAAAASERRRCQPWEGDAPLRCSASQRAVSSTSCVELIEVEISVQIQRIRKVTLDAHERAAGLIIKPNNNVPPPKQFDQVRIIRDCAREHSHSTCIHSVLPRIWRSQAHFHVPHRRANNCRFSASGRSDCAG